MLLFGSRSWLLRETAMRPPSLVSIATLSVSRSSRPLMFSPLPGEPGCLEPRDGVLRVSPLAPPRRLAGLGGRRWDAGASPAAPRQDSSVGVRGFRGRSARTRAGADGPQGYTPAGGGLLCGGLRHFTPIVSSSRPHYSASLLLDAVFPLRLFIRRF